MDRTEAVAVVRTEEADTARVGHQGRVARPSYEEKAAFSFFA